MFMEKYKYAGQTLITKDNVGMSSFRTNLGNKEFVAEDYWINITGKSWKDSNGNPVALEYAFRMGMRLGEVPLDDKVVYGKIDNFGHMFHESELIVK